MSLWDQHREAVKVRDRTPMSEGFAAYQKAARRVAVLYALAKEAERG